MDMLWLKKFLPKNFSNQFDFYGGEYCTKEIKIIILIWFEKIYIYIYILFDGFTYNTRGYFASCVRGEEKYEQ